MLVCLWMKGGFYMYGLELSYGCAAHLQGKRSSGFAGVRLY